MFMLIHYLMQQYYFVAIGLILLPRDLPFAEDTPPQKSHKSRAVMRAASFPHFIE